METQNKTLVETQTHPSQYRHWKLSFDGPLAILGLDVAEDGGLVPGYKLKLNSYDLSVDIELADALQRLRFEHPETRCVVVRSLKERVFCAGANIFMLGQSSHAFKVNFCKFTNETRLGLEDAAEHSGLLSLCAVNGPCAGGGYELAMACNEILLVDDGNSSVSLPEVPLLGVLPGTGGLTRLVDKRKVRRDRAEVFSTSVEGVRGKRAVQWGMVDGVAARRDFEDTWRRRALELAERSKRPVGAKGIVLEPLQVTVDDGSLTYRYVSVRLNRSGRQAELTLRVPEGQQPATPTEIEAAGSSFWALQAFRELDHAMLYLRLNEDTLGTWILRTEGEAETVRKLDRTLVAHADHWLVNEIRHFLKRTLKRLDMSARGLFALIEPGSCFVGSLLELALAADRSFMLNDPDKAVYIGLTEANFGLYPMGNGLTRLETRFLGSPETITELRGVEATLGPERADAVGLITAAPDDIDWEDEIRQAIQERASMSPDALTGLEANLRFAGPETLETKIFGRLTAWQNWIFQRPNAVGARGALKVYGQAGVRPEFDWQRT